MTKWAVAAIALFAACSVGAASYPTKPVRLLVGYPPGGPNDLTARIVAQHLTETLGQQFIVDNRAGAGGTVALTTLTQSAPDGYTLGYVANGEMAIAPNLYAKLPYDALRDTVRVSRVGAAQLALLVHPSVAAKSTAELVALAKAKPGGVNFASAGNGSTSHLCAELFRHLAAIDIVHVPYKGAGPALVDLMGGQVQMLITGYAATVPHIKAGKVRILAVTGAKRMSAVPNLPTIGETVKGYEATSWYGVVGPAKMPATMVSRLHGEIAAMMKKPEVVERFVTLGIEPEGNSPQEFSAQIKAETEKWGRIVKLAQVKVD